MGRTLKLSVILDNRGQARRAAGGIQEVTECIRAQRAGVTQSTLGTLGSLGTLSATASLADKLTSSQYALGEASFQAAITFNDHVSMYERKTSSKYLERRVAPAITFSLLLQKAQKLRLLQHLRETLLPLSIQRIR